MAADAPAKTDRAAYEAAVSKAIDYLRTKGEAPDGSYSARSGGAVTSIATASILAHGRSPDDPAVAKSLKYLEGFVQPDGGIYAKDSRIPNYETCVALICFAAANKDGRYNKLIANAEKFVKGLQWDGDQEKRSSVNFGGAGYGKDSRPDLSNTAFLLDALQAAGAGPNDEAVKNAMVFVSRCQNLESADNTTKFAAKEPDGGFYYTPAAGGSSPAGESNEGALRSYGSMTYAGLKSMIFAGLKPDDPRVKAAVKWLSQHYDLSANPGLGQAGVYYYYHLMAKALDALGGSTFKDSQGNEHAWRQELSAELIKRQRGDGSWVNENRQWMEGDPNLCTAFALLTLSYCRAPK
jgi:squalene-hopene/tetraprenyl-beta-curcumene cyclase